MVLQCSNAVKWFRWNGKQYKSWSDCTLKSSLIWVCTVCLYVLAQYLDGWLVIFMSFLTVFKSYQDSGWVIMKGCVQWKPFYNWKDSHFLWGLNIGSSGQHLTHWAIQASLCKRYFHNLTILEWFMPLNYLCSHSTLRKTCYKVTLQNCLIYIDYKFSPFDFILQSHSRRSSQQCLGWWITTRFVVWPISTCMYPVRCFILL